MTKIVILTGKAQSGKDTNCDALKRFFKEEDRSCKKYPFAEALKTFCIDVLGLTYQQCWGTDKDKNTLTHIRWNNLPLDHSDILRLAKANNVKHEINEIDGDYEPSCLTARQVMQIFGTDICRKMYPDCWANAVKSNIKKDGLDFALLSDARFPNELDSFMKFDPIVIRLMRNPLDGNHFSETALDKYDFFKFKNYHLIDNSNKSIPHTINLVRDIVEKHL